MHSQSSSAGYSDLERERLLTLIAWKERELQAKQPKATRAFDYARYADDPCRYAREVLGVTWWAKQREIAEALIKHRRVLVKASHSIGKSHLGGGLINWFFDSRRPSITLSTAPTQPQVEDVLWKEVRIQRRGRPGLQPKAARMELAPDHFAVGYTARSDTAFQGRHEANLLAIFDEATDIDGAFWDATEGMMTGPETYWLAILNPTDTASRAYEEDQSGRWHVVTVSALEHPNIIAELRGDPAPIPAAVRLEWVEDKVKRWCSAVADGDTKATDLEWPPHSGQYRRPGPLFDSRVAGRWPTQGAESVWSEALWEAACRQQPVPKEPLKGGCDVARFGDDFTSIMFRRGPCVLHHETHNGWGTDQTAGRLKELAGSLTTSGEDPKKVDINIDDDGVGGGVIDNKGDFAFRAVSGASRALQPRDYPNLRSELWFATAERAAESLVDVSRLSDDSRSLLRRQLMSPKWKLDSQGRRVVERKEDTKKRIKRSPDDADAFNLMFHQGSPFFVI